MNQPLRHLTQLARSSTWAALVLFLPSCGQSLSDDQSGFIDLVPFYSGATAADPNAGLPRVISPKRGWIGGQRIEYYDFGPVGNVRKRNAAGTEIRDPAYANVFPMYFFFDSHGRPLFSTPAFNSQNGNWYMLGGKNPVNPSPLGPPGAGQERTDYYNTVYWRRPRNILTDEARGSSEFQRPVIDNLAINAATANTTGLFEIVEITVNDSYHPDAIKSASTILKGVADGTLSQRNTGKVINCPLVDERTAIITSAMNNNIPRPRIQYWYRTNLGECFLANGWETIGEVIDENRTATDPGNLRLFGTGDLDKRVSTFDSFDFVVGAGQSGAAHAVVAAVGKLYTPLPPKGRTANDDIAIALPRHKATDPGGYSPIAWLWDINVPAVPTYQPGSMKDLGAVDLAAATARDVTPTVITSNIAILGPANKCVTDTDCKWGMTCNLLPDVDLATFNFPQTNPGVYAQTVYPPDPGQSVVDVTIAREGGPRCDVPAVGYGQYCGAGITRCELQSPVGGENEKRLKAIGAAIAGPTFTIHADQRTAMTALTTAQTAQMTAMTTLTTAQTALDTANMGGDAMAIATASTAVTTATAALTTATATVTSAQNTLNGLNTRVAGYDMLGYTADFAGYGYFCFPPVSGTTNPPTLGGFCHIRCDASASSTGSTAMVDLSLSSGGTYQSTFLGEARCGGLNMLGYKCLPSTSTNPTPDRQRVCLRSCNTRNTNEQNAAICGYQLNQKADPMGAPVTSFSFSNGQPARTAVTGQMCTAIPGTSACNWIPDFEPRDPAEWGGP